MPRFTIGSLLTGLVLAYLVVTVLHSWSTTSLVQRAVDTGRMAPPDGPAPTAIDPVRGTVSLGDAKANDYALEDSFPWDGGMDAATW